jgi:hypothetical protein
MALKLTGKIDLIETRKQECLNVADHNFKECKERTGIEVCSYVRIRNYNDCYLQFQKDYILVLDKSK